MKDRVKGQKPESSSTAIFELPGEPAVIINGVPKVSPICDTLVLTDVKQDGESQGNTGCGEWLEGRKVKKMFGDQLYTGTVTEFDKESGWYRVVYEDGDLEDLEWRELEDVLLPVDINIPLKALALKQMKKSQKTAPKSGQKAAGSGTKETKLTGRKGKKTKTVRKA